MKNFIWHRNPQEAYKNPYEYEAQEQFAREASSVLYAFKSELEKYNRNFHRDDKSLQKAIWMLNIDATDSLIDCLELLLNKRHKIAGRLIRDAVEVLDLSAFFRSKTTRSLNQLEKWYQDVVVPNSEYRDFVKKNVSAEMAEELKSVYSQLSKINHRTYRSLSYGYILGKENKLVYDGFSNTFTLIYPGVISMFYALLGNMITILSEEIVKSELVSRETEKIIWENSIEEIPILRKFKYPEEIQPKSNVEKKSQDTIADDVIF